MAYVMSEEKREERRAKARAKWRLGKETKAEWFLKKKAWKTKYDIGYNLKNADKKRAQGAVWLAKNAERHRLTSKRWKLQHPEKHRAHVNKATLKYIKLHPEVNRSHVRAYQARKFNAETDKTAVSEYMLSVFSASPVKCSYCPEILSRNQITFDHIVPISRGGSHLPSNLCPACKPCNSRKHNKLLSELNWVISQ